MRTIDEHIVTDADRRITITVMDGAGHGGASHHYIIDCDGGGECDIYFQKGPVAENGINGITQEVLIAICIDRMRAFQRGEFSCRENALALTKLDEAMLWLQSRTRARMIRGVEGKTQP